MAPILLTAVAVDTSSSTTETTYSVAVLAAASTARPYVTSPEETIETKTSESPIPPTAGSHGAGGMAMLMGKVHHSGGGVKS